MRPGAKERVARHRLQRAKLAEIYGLALDLFEACYRDAKKELERRQAEERWAVSHPPPEALSVRKKGARR